MIYLSNFFARKVEAVSRQIEESRGSNKNPIITCGYFLNQKILSFQDIKDNIWVFPKWLYPFVAFIVVILTKSDIHLFEDEPSWWRLTALNIRKRSIYVSLFKDIDENLIKYINKIKYITTIVVEDEISYRLIQQYLENKNIEVKLIYPSPLWKHKFTEGISTNHLLFASWNSGTLDELYERGICDLLTIVEKSDAICTIVLRDNEIKELNSLINKKKITKKVNLLKPSDIDELKTAYELCNYTVMIPRAPVMKYTPNSIIDGLVFGKLCIISDNLRFSQTVREYGLGIVTSAPVENIIFPDREKYAKLMRSCFNWSITNIKYPYSDAIKEVYSK